jgi:hypothetical protein
MKLIELPTTLQYLGVQNRLIETTSLPTTLQCLDLQHCYGLTDIPLLSGPCMKYWTMNVLFACWTMCISEMNHASQHIQLKNFNLSPKKNINNGKSPIFTPTR